MSILSGWVEADGPLVEVVVSLSRPELLRRRLSGQSIPPTLRALLDTGAECTCVDPRHVGTLALPLRGVTLVNLPSLGGMSGATQHDAGLAIVHSSGDAAENLVVPEFPLTELSLGQIGYHMLIGRDLLDRCLLIYDGPGGTFCLSY